MIQGMLSEGKAVICSNCGETLGVRLGDTLLTASLRIEFKKTHRLDCKCGAHTLFRVESRKHFERQAKSAKM